jgi:GntR family transcriptional regulator/MocR family aminotransferase
VPKRSRVVLLDIAVDRASKVPLQRQVYLGIRRLILAGRLKPGTRLPSTRLLANDLNVARTTVLDAFGQLIFEGYLQGKIGSGTRVSSHIPHDVRTLAFAKEQDPVPPLHRKPRIARRALAHSFRPRLTATPARPFRPGVPDIASLPLDLWSRLTAKHWRRAADQLYEHADSLGYLPLRKAICDYVSRARAVRCDPDQVVITTGAQQALYLCAKTLLDPAEPVWMEDPGYPRAKAAFDSAQLRVIPIPVDSEGLNLASSEKRTAPQMIYVTPSFQCPLGYMMTLERRFGLLRVAARSNAWILEDDYFSEFRYGTNPVASLQGLDRNERVIYIGNFSKNVVPFLRIGFLVAPRPIVHTLKVGRTSVSRQPPGIEQAALAEFIADGHLERHIKVTLQIYRERHEALVSAIREYGGGVLELSDNCGVGMYLVAWLPRSIDDRAAARIASAAGIDAVPLSSFALRKLPRSGLLLGYSAYGAKIIPEAAQQLCRSLQTLRRM